MSSSLGKYAALSWLIPSLMLAACASGPVDPEDRDTTGSYDGVWVAHVDEPRSSHVSLPGNWRMNCGWEPFEVYFQVDDGRLQLGRMEQKTPVSSEGKFHLEVKNDAAEMVNGTMPGNGRYVDVFSGDFSGSEPKGRYMQYISSIGSYGCEGRMTIEPYNGES